jgi:hypothetical protein
MSAVANLKLVVSASTFSRTRLKWLLTARMFAVSLSSSRRLLVCDAPAKLALPRALRQGTQCRRNLFTTLQIEGVESKNWKQFSLPWSNASLSMIVGMVMT